MRVLFLDATRAGAYDASKMRAQGLGGTEASVVRVATALSEFHEVVVAQRGRADAASPWPTLRYRPMDHADPFGGPAPDCIVVLRKHRWIPRLRARYPAAAMLLWIQNWQRPLTVLLSRAALARSDCGIVAASDAHREATDRLVNGAPARLVGALLGGRARIPVLCIYNPVDEQLAADGTPVDRDKLIFVSNKGLNQVLRTFGAVRREIPSLRLYLAGVSAEAMERDLGSDSTLARQEGVHLLGRLPQGELFPHVRESLCVFYPQDKLAETFGLVFAESNALGTPVLAHDFGAAREVLGGTEQLVDAHDVRAIVAKLRDWREGGRPRVSLRPEFRLSAVVARWNALLERERAARTARVTDATALARDAHAEAGERGGMARGGS